MSEVTEDQALVALARATGEVLTNIGETDREGLRDTPNRVAKMWLEITSGLRTPPPKMTTFDRGDNDQMITVLGIDYYSLCEHHLVPFYGQAHIGYIPGDRIVGLSKIARVVDWFAHRPQIQEQLTAQTADFLMRELQPRGLMVVVEGTHLCMVMRGVKKPNSVTVTSAIRGDFVRSEFLDLLKMRRGGER